MSPQPSIPVNPEVLRWAREESGYDVDRVAARLAVKEERVQSWELGERQPTQRQLEKLAHFLRRPLGIFFLPRPPRLAALATEYRRLPGVEPGHETPELRLALRQMINRRDRALELTEEFGDAGPPFRLRAHLNETPSDVGARLRAATGVVVGTQLAWPNAGRAWNSWRAAVEGLGVLVFQFPGVQLNEVRGLALLRTSLPVVGINSKEIPEARSFTLFHEIVHLMLALSREEAPASEERRSDAEWGNVERFAEMAASHALVPESMLLDILPANAQGLDWGIEDVRRLARRTKISPLAMATRLRESGLMDWPRYRRWREEWDAYVANLPPRKGGFASPVEKAVGRAGRPFVTLVLDALSANRITSTDASRYLDLKFEHFEKLSSHLRESRGGAPFDE